MNVADLKVFDVDLPAGDCKPPGNGCDSRECRQRFQELTPLQDSSATLSAGSAYWPRIPPGED